MKAAEALAIILSVAFLSGCSERGRSEGRFDQYMYRDTRQLVSLVEDAAVLLEKQGLPAFRELGVKGSRWFNESHYIFAYDLNGRNIFHPAYPELLGKSLIDFRDIVGRPLIRQITDVGRRPEPDAFGWVFYFWEDNNEFQPHWKNAYIRKVVLPDGTSIVIGSGSYTIKVERVFVKDRVDAAVKLLKTEGRAATFRALRDDTSEFNFLGIHIFVLDARGRALVDPAFPTLEGRDLSGFKDAVGHPVMKELFRRLENTDSVWLQFLFPRPGETVPSRKLMYCRKVEVDGETLLVGSDFFQATPIWMNF
jgi:signal transduction histidine kinase